MSGPLGQAPTADFLDRRVPCKKRDDRVLGKSAGVAERGEVAFGAPCTAIAENLLKGYGLAVNALPPGLRLIGALRFGPARFNSGTLVCDTPMTNQLTPLQRTARELIGSQQPGFEVRIRQAPMRLPLAHHAEATRQVRSDLGSPRELIYPKALRKFRTGLDRRVPRSHRASASTPQDLRNQGARTSHLETWMKQHKPVFTPQPDNDTPLARLPRVVANS